MSSVAKPMICPNLTTGCPLAMGCAAILWPRMMRAAAVTPSVVVPGSTLSTATMILSRALSRSVRGSFFSARSGMGAFRTLGQTGSADTIAQPFAEGSGIVPSYGALEPVQTTQRPNSRARSPLRGRSERTCPNRPAPPVGHPRARKLAPDAQRRLFTEDRGVIPKLAPALLAHHPVAGIETDDLAQSLGRLPLLARWLSSLERHGVPFRPTAGAQRV